MLKTDYDSQSFFTTGHVGKINLIISLLIDNKFDFFFFYVPTVLYIKMYSNNNVNIKNNSNVPILVIIKKQIRIKNHENVSKIEIRQT